MDPYIRSGPWIPLFSSVHRSLYLDPSVDPFILNSEEIKQKNVQSRHSIQISGEIRHFFVQCEHWTKKCPISPLRKCLFQSQCVRRSDTKMSNLPTQNVFFPHRFPVLFLLPRFTIMLYRLFCFQDNRNPITQGLYLKY